MKNIKKLLSLVLLAAMLLSFCGCSIVSNLSTQDINDIKEIIESLITEDAAVTAEPTSAADPTKPAVPTTPADPTNPTDPKAPADPTVPAAEPTRQDEPTKPKTTVEKDKKYYDLEHVVLYLDKFGKLPSNYITKDKAEAKGWPGGSLEKYVKGGAIGGDYFGNYEKLLPTAKNRKYTECDIDTNGAKSRGAKRLVFSNDGLYFYTDDHYESFREVVIIDGEVKFK